jgi:hypothetical protein
MPATSTARGGCLMPVHIGELHTEVVPTGTSDESARHSVAEPEWVRQEKVTEPCSRTEWLRRRVCAEGFDD